MTVSYEERDNYISTSYVNYFTIAHYDHKSKSFENFAVRNNLWKSNEGKYLGIHDNYREDVPEDDDAPKSYKRTKTEDENCQ